MALNLIRHIREIQFDWLATDRFSANIIINCLATAALNNGSIAM